MASVSVIVPVYNLEILLSRCLDSVLAQTFTDFELLIIDDGSTDISGVISDNYAALSDKVTIVHKTNGGVSFARNMGLELSSGEYICFVDSDDFILPDYVLSLIDCMEKTDADCVSQNVISLSGDSESIISRQPYEVSFSCEKDKYDFIEKKVLQGVTSWEMWGRVFKKSIISSNHIKVCESCGNYAEDLAFFLTYIINCKKCCHIEYAGYCYYQRNESMMDKSKDSFKLNSLNEVSKYLYDYFYSNQKNYYLNDFALLHFWIMKTEFSKIYKVDRSLIKHEVKQIKNYKWYKKHIKRCIFYFDRIASVCSKNVAFDFCNLSYFSLHKNYKLFHMIEVIFYKFLNP